MKTVRRVQENLFDIPIPRKDQPRGLPMAKVAPLVTALLADLLSAEKPAVPPHGEKSEAVP